MENKTLEIKTLENNIQEIPRKSAKKKYKIETCKVIGYDKNRKTLNILFKGYGIQLIDIKEQKKDFVKIKYTSDIGKGDFSYEFVEWI